MMQSQMFKDIKAASAQAQKKAGKVTKAPAAKAGVAAKVAAVRVEDRA